MSGFLVYLIIIGVLYICVQIMVAICAQIQGHRRIFQKLHKGYDFQNLEEIPPLGVFLRLVIGPGLFIASLLTWLECRSNGKRNESSRESKLGNPKKFS